MTTADLSGVLGGVQPNSCTIISSRRTHNRIGVCWAALQVCTDFLAINGAIWFTYWVYSHFGLGHQARYSFSDLFFASSCIAFLSIFVFRHYHLYEVTVTLLNIHEIENTLRGVAIISGLAMIYFFFDRPQPASRWLALVSPVVATAFILIERRVGLVLIRWVHQQGYGVRRVAIYGTTHAREVVKIIRRNPRLGLRCAGFISEDPRATNRYLLENDIDSDVLGSWDELADLVSRKNIDEVIVADQKFTRDHLLSLITQCSECGVAFSAVADLFGSYQSWFRYELVDGLPIARCRHSALSRRGALVKRSFDLVLASIILLLLSPVLLLVAMLIKWDSSGPIFFRHERVGKDGRLFRMFKFRSMHVDSPRYAPSPKGSSDTRITRIGRILRRTSLDELPQLINVIRGEMSLVGPRPEMPFIAAQYGPLERSRLRVHPGITGLWQVSPARAEPIHHNIEYDLFYIEHQNLFLDFAILVYTCLSVVRGVGAY